MTRKIYHIYQLANTLMLCVLPMIRVEGATNSSSPAECSLCFCFDDRFEGALDCTFRSADTFNKVLAIKLQNYTHVNFKYSEIEVISTIFPEARWKVLALANNKITQIKIGAFVNLPLLEWLDLGSNLLTSDKLLPGVFKGKNSTDGVEHMQNLRKLDLGYNKLHMLHRDLFKNLPNLEILILSANPFKHIDGGTAIALSSFLSLNSLHIGDTGISEIPDHLLHTLRNLTILTLSGNEFSRFPGGLTHLINLRFLYFGRNNQMQVIRVFPYLPKLEVLHINNMPQLTRIEKGGLNGLPALKELYCNYNTRLEYIDPAALKQQPTLGGEQKEYWPPLKKINLANNWLTHLDEALFDQWDQLEVLVLSGNLWSCDCRHQWLITRLIPAMRNNNRSYDIDMTCFTPLELRDKKLVELAEVNYQLCPQNTSASPTDTVPHSLGV